MDPEVTRKNLILGFALFILAAVIAVLTIVAAVIFNAVD